MKQLKFMLAAATAIGLATAAQAAVTRSDTQFTDTFEEGHASATLEGYVYIPEEGGTYADNESAVVAGGYQGEKALKVNTGTTPLLRGLDYSTAANPVSLGDYQSVYIDTMVQFTVTPAGDTVEAGDNKLMIYLQETNVVSTVDGVETTTVQTNLMVKAAMYTVGDEFAGTVDSFDETDVVATAENLTITAGVWYNLVVVAAVEDGVPVFTVSIDNKPLSTANALFGADNTKFPSLTGKDDTTLTYVGFAGEGMVDNLSFTTVSVVTAVDFTLTLGTGVSAVTYVIGDAAAVTITDATTLEGLEAAKIYITAIDYLMGYKAGTNGTGEHNVTAAGLTIDATEVAFNDGTGEGLATTATELGITGGAFAEAGSTELKRVFDWGKAKGVPVSKISGMNFSNGNPAGTTDEAKEVEEAYLLNCAPAELGTAKADFKFAAFDPEKPPVADDFSTKGYNGKVVIEGATTLKDATTGKPDWAAGKVDPKFYRARLIFE